jgi:hypothetical protein
MARILWASGWLVRKLMEFPDPWTSSFPNMPSFRASTLATLPIMLSAAVFRDAQVTLLAVRAKVADLPFVVPLEARSRYVGVDLTHQRPARRCNSRRARRSHHERRRSP